MIALSDLRHLFARPETKERLLRFFSEVLELTPVEITKAYLKSPEPMYLVKFANGAGISVEFGEDALSDRQALRGAWFELKADDAEVLQQRALAFGLRRIVHPSTPFFYIQAPGGQVFRIVAGTPDPTLQVVRGYHAAWTNGNFDEAIRRLAPDLRVEGPAREYPSKAAFAQALTGYGRFVKSTTLLAEFARGAEAVLLYDMDVDRIGALRVAEHFTVAGGSIARIRQVHDTGALKTAGFVRSE